jgi:hypothetical protein
MFHVSIAMIFLLNADDTVVAFAVFFLPCSPSMIPTTLHFRRRPEKQAHP